MTRTHLTALVLAALPALAACYGDMISTQPAGERFEGVPIDATELDCLDPPAASAGDGYHNPGAACLGCHDGASAPAFSMAGTLYADPAGTTPLAGLSISIVDASDARIDVVSGDNGNFYALEPIVFPAVAYVSACPDLVAMPIELTVGDCNSCHIGGERVTFSP